MATNTPNFGLKKPAQSDYYNIDDTNENMNTIDTQLKLLKEKNNEQDTQLKSLQEKNSEQDAWAKPGYPSTATVYVDADNGSDTNTGISWGTSFKTVNKALNSVNPSTNLTINLRGNYTDGITIDSWAGSLTIVLGLRSTGATSYMRSYLNINNVQSFNIMGETMSAFQFTQTIVIENSTCDIGNVTTQQGIRITNSRCTISSIDFLSYNYAGDSAIYIISSNIHVNYCTFTGRNRAILAERGSLLTILSILGTNNTTGIELLYSSICTLNTKLPTSFTTNTNNAYVSNDGSATRGGTFLFGGRILNSNDPLIQTGRANLTPIANTPTSIWITFPKPFIGVPTVVLTPLTAVPGTMVTGMGVSDTTTLGFTAWITRTNTSSTGFNWIAMAAD